MKFYKKPIFTGFAPNLKIQDVFIAVGFLCLPWRWKKLRVGDSVGKVEGWLKNYFQTRYAFTFDSGRTALHYALKALGAGHDSEVLVQSYTCVVVINAIKWTGAKPIYVDIDNNFCIDYTDLIKKITQKTKILIIQHTFGRPANLDKLLEIAREQNLKIIEDCAHSLGAKHNGQFTGTFGDIGMFSFGSDKNVSCVRGGALITNDDDLAKKITDFRSRLPLSRRVKVIQHLWHYPAFAKGKLLYNLGIGKFILAVAKKINLINKIIYQPEKEGKQVLFYPSLLPNALAEILLNQLKHITQTMEHRRMIARIYDSEIKNETIKKPEWSDESVWLRYTLLVKNPQALHALAKKQGIILGNWYDCPVAPKDIDLSATDYQLGSCPNDEKLSQMSINLPTDPCVTQKDAGRIVDIINIWR